MADEREVILRVENLKQYFRLGRGSVVKAVDDISFEIKKGEVFGMVGESGCGKTTCGRDIIRLYEITAGDIYFKGQRISSGIKDKRKTVLKLRKEGKTEEADALHQDYVKAKADLQKVAGSNVMAKMQMIFQDPVASLNPRMTVREIIAEGLIIRGIRDKDYIDKRVREMLQVVGLVPEHAERYPHEFSGGQKQRIGIARAMVLEPDLIIADEPISALDVSIQAQVINLLNDLRHSMGLTIMFIAHDLSVVKYFSDRIAVMYYGRMVELADTDELFAHPFHPYTRALLSAIPLPDPNYEKQRVRIKYEPAIDHDYAVDKPTFREVLPNHFVLCNDAEEEKYKASV